MRIVLVCLLLTIVGNIGANPRVHTDYSVVANQSWLDERSGSIDITNLKTGTSYTIYTDSLPSNLDSINFNESEDGFLILNPVSDKFRVIPPNKNLWFMTISHRTAGIIMVICGIITALFAAIGVYIINGLANG
jgi:hypothetical protein